MPSNSSPDIHANTETDSPDYSTVKVPTTKPPEEFSYMERRADLLRQIRDLGHPSMITQVEAAERYGVAQSTISKDLDRLAESVREHIVDRDRRAFTVDSVMQRAIIGLLEEDEYRKAAKTAREWHDWIAEFEDLSALAERVAALEADAGDDEKLALTDLYGPDDDSDGDPKDGVNADFIAFTEGDDGDDDGDDPDTVVDFDDVDT